MEDSKVYVKSKLKELEGHKQRKLTKAEKSDELANLVARYVDEKLNEGKVLNMMQGAEINNHMLLDYINDGHGIDDVKSFIEKNLSQNGKDAMIKVVNKNI